MLKEEIDVDLVQSMEEMDLSSLEDAAEQAPVVKLVNLILMDAIRKQASDIHLEPYEKSMRVRFRIDGVLYEVMRPPLHLKNALISRIKIMSRLDIAERRLPQDGRIKLKAKGREMDFRVSVLPTLFGEKVVLRLLDKASLQLDMTKLGFEEIQYKNFREAIYMPFGMVLVTGPTGSGKTTTLYSALSDLNKVSHNISTAEDPIEYNLTGINQVQVHEAIGLSFRRRPALVFASGPGHHHGRRDQRLRNGGNRRESGPHRTPRAEYPPHQRCPQHNKPAAQHGGRSLSRCLSR